MKKYILCMLASYFMLTNISSSYSEVYNSTMDLEDGQTAEKYETVQIYCSEIACTLFCFQPGDWKECRFDQATWCEGCNSQLFVEAEGQYMFDYAISQINIGNISGSYNNNLFIEPENRTIYRTISWVADLYLQKSYLELTISE